MTFLQLPGIEIFGECPTRPALFTTTAAKTHRSFIAQKPLTYYDGASDETKHAGSRDSLLNDSITIGCALCFED